MLCPHSFPPTRRVGIISGQSRKAKRSRQGAMENKGRTEGSIQGPTCQLRACPSDSGLFAKWICHPVLSGLQATHCSQKRAAASGELSAFGCDSLGRPVFSIRHRHFCCKEGEVSLGSILISVDAETNHYKCSSFKQHNLLS